jgi:hypothetical protein
LSLPTVKKHVHLIFRKLEVGSRSQLMTLMRCGIASRDLGKKIPFAAAALDERGTAKKLNRRLHRFRRLFLAALRSRIA